MTIKEKSGNILKEMIVEKGVKQSWIANKLGVSPSRFSQMLNNDVGIKVTLDILNLIGFTFEEFNKRYLQSN